MERFESISGAAPALYANAHLLSRGESADCEGLFELCRGQHDDIAALFTTWMSLDPKATVTRRLVAAELLTALEDHLNLETKSFVPLYREVDDARGRLAEEHLQLLRGLVRVTARAVRLGREVEGKIILLFDLFHQHRAEQEDREMLAVKNSSPRRKDLPAYLRTAIKKDSIRIC